MNYFALFRKSRYCGKINLTVLRVRRIYVTYKDSVCTSQKTRSAATQKYQSVNANDFSKNRTKLINTLCRQNAQVLSFKIGYNH
jgi:hypothetical protein